MGRQGVWGRGEGGLWMSPVDAQQHLPIQIFCYVIEYYIFDAWQSS